MVIPTEDINRLVKELASYASAFADYDEAEYLVHLRDELQEHVDAAHNL